MMNFLKRIWDALGPPAARPDFFDELERINADLDRQVMNIAGGPGQSSSAWTGREEKEATDIALKREMERFRAATSGKPSPVFKAPVHIPDCDDPDDESGNYPPVFKAHGFPKLPSSVPNHGSSPAVPGGGRRIGSHLIWFNGHPAFAHPGPRPAGASVAHPGPLPPSARDLAADLAREVREAQAPQPPRESPMPKLTRELVNAVVQSIIDDSPDGMPNPKFLGDILHSRLMEALGAHQAFGQFLDGHDTDSAQEGTGQASMSYYTKNMVERMRRTIYWQTPGNNGDLEKHMITEAQLQTAIMARLRLEDIEVPRT